MLENLFEDFIRDYATGFRFEENKVIFKYCGLDYRLEINLIDFTFKFYSVETNLEIDRPAWEESKVNKLCEVLKQGDEHNVKV